MSKIIPATDEWSRFFKVLPDVVIVVGDDATIIHASAGMEELVGYEHDELTGLAPDALVVRSRRSKSPFDLARSTGATDVRKSDSPNALRLMAKDATTIDVDAVVTRVSFSGRSWTLAAFSDARTDDDARRQSRVEVILAQLSCAEVLAESEERFRLAFDANMSPMIFTDLDDRIIEANGAFCQMIGRESEEVVGHDSTIFTYPDDVGITEEFHRQISQGEASGARYNKRYQHKDGRVIVVEVSKSPVRDTRGETLYYVISERDITERLRRNHILELLAKVNQLALLTSDEALFVQQLCDLLVREGGYELAWVAAVTSPDVDGVDVICSAGATDYLYGDMVTWWGTEESGRGPTGTALRTGTTQVAADLSTNDLYGPWRERAARFGFGSSIAIPDRLGDRMGALCLYHRQILAFDDMTVKGLEEIVRASKFAIAHVRSVKTTEAALADTNLAINALRETEHALSESEQRFRLAFENNMSPMVFSDHDDLAIGVNDAFCDMVGFTREELIGHDSKHFTYPEDIGITERTHRRLVADELDQIRYAKRYQRKDGRVIIAEVSRSAAHDANGNTLYFLSSERDVTEERELTAQLSHQALHDPLTGLPNRALLDDRLARAHARVVRYGGFGAAILLDLDDFKEVNDTHGHVVGDQLLVRITRRFEKVTRTSDTLCRLGGDEFLYLAEGLASANEAEDVARRLLSVLNDPFSIDRSLVEQHASVGVVVWDQSSSESTEIIQNADVALYEAKRSAKGHYVVFTPSMQEKVVGRVALASELRQALSNGDLAMHYQPIVDLATSKVVGFEALMRWQHADRGWVPPIVFIPVAEQSDLILDLGAFALRSAVETAMTWIRSDGGELPYVTVNLSAHQFRDPALITTIERALKSSGLPSHRLILEITESVALLEATQTTDTITRLHDLGVGLALDDFGTGFSSLSYLMELDPKIIKIDQSFVRPKQESVRNDAILRTIISLGNNVQMTMLAEGIETVHQLEQLRSLGCELGQGYLFSPAVPPSEAAALLDRGFEVGQSSG